LGIAIIRVAMKTKSDSFLELNLAILPESVERLCFFIHHSDRVSPRLSSES